MIGKIDSLVPTYTPATGRKASGEKLAFEAIHRESKEPATQVKISSTAANKLRTEQENSGNGRSATLSEIAHANPAEAAKLAFDFANAVDQPLLDISGGLNNVKYSQTGIPVSKETTELFQQQAIGLTAKKQALYQTEKDKGTSDADIFDKLLSLVSSQSEQYKGIIGFGLRERGLS